MEGSGLGADLGLVSFVCVSGPRPLRVAWRLLEGAASAKGQEATVTRALVQQALPLEGPGRIDWLLVDALDAEGPLLAWLTDGHGIDVLVPLPADRRRYQDGQGLAQTGLIPWSRPRSPRTIQGHQGRRVVAVASAEGRTSWESFTEAARSSGVPAAARWGCLIREVEPETWPLAEAEALVRTRTWPDGFVALQGDRPRWHIENDGDRSAFGCSDNEGCFKINFAIESKALPKLFLWCCQPLKAHAVLLGSISFSPASRRPSSCRREG